MAKIEYPLALCLLLAIAASTSALYFPQSNITVRVPYNLRNELAEVNLITVRTLPDDSSIPEDLSFQILSKDNLISLNSKNGSIMLNRFPTSGDVKTSLVRANDKTGEEAFLEIKILPIAVKDGKINCTDYLQDMCFWNTSKYRIYENQPKTMLGTIGPDIYKSLCPNIFVSAYELLNGTDFFYVEDNELHSHELLDRDKQEGPKGTGPHTSVNVMCAVWEKTTGIQYTFEKVLNVDVLDQDDNPPVSQTNRIVEIDLKDFTEGEKLDGNDLLINDADDIRTNTYSVRLLEDIYNVLHLKYDIMSVDHPKLTKTPSTTIFAKLYSRTTLLPKSPYQVILQVKDESLLPGFGNNTINITLSFSGPQRHTTTTTAASLAKQRITYPEVAQLSRNSSRYYRIAQPLQRVNSKVVFSLRGPAAFNITRSGGIVYVTDASRLLSVASTVSLRIEWQAQDQRTYNATVTVKIIETIDSCKQNLMNEHSCANAKSASECEGRCGISTGSSSSSDVHAGGCMWRSNKVNVSTMTEKYETCSPDLSFCPNYICDELEHLDHRICPQDCAIESEVRFAEMNKDGRGIRSGFGICWCDDDMQCTCGTSFRKPPGSGAGVNKEARETSRARKERDRMAQVATSDARKATGSTCGPTCLIGIIAASLFVLIIIIGSFVMWRYRIVTKVPRRGCMHGGSDAANGLGILPLDYVDRGDGLLIGLESLTAVNRTLLAPKNTTPDPKWEFPRSRLIIEQVLGEGEFGRVLRAKAQDISGWSGQTTVAVKTLKEDASASELADLLSEYQLLKEAQHPNVIRLLGACTTAGGPIYLIIEFAEFGSLRNYLRRSRHLESEGRVPCSTLLLSSSPNKSLDQQSLDPSVNYTITPRDILSFAWQISKGMAYLADIKLVHRDLAARNVLLATGKVCKISDFGLTRDVYEDDAYLKRSKGRVPVKWMAPESLADHVYTSKSDVWSFGVLLWELVTLGASPYPGVDVHNLYNLLKAGYRMEKPANCSHQLYKLMVSCWHEEPGMRPSFKELTSHWERMLEDAVEYLDLNPRTVHNQAYFTSLHTLDSPSSSGDSPKNVVSYALVNPQHKGTDNGVNYMSRPSFEPVSKCDKVDKLEALWQEPVEAYPDTDATGSAYVNESASEAHKRQQQQQATHYESPIKLRHASVASSSENELAPSNEAPRPQSYIDMQAGKRDSEELLLSFGSLDAASDDTTLNDFDE